MDKFTLNRKILPWWSLIFRLVAVMKYREQVVKNNKILPTAAREFDLPVLVTEHIPGVGENSTGVGEDLKIGRFAKNYFSAGGEGKIGAALEKLRKKLLLQAWRLCLCVTICGYDSPGFYVHVVQMCVLALEN